MRSWRVGSISMGASLLLLGICLLLTQLFHIDQAAFILVWWPVILIILGIEILLFLFFANKENTVIKYDLFSIFLVGCIGMVGIVLTLLSTTGVLHKFNDWLTLEEVTLDLPQYEQMINRDTIKRIVVHSGAHPITIENSTDEEISIFGTYRTQTTHQEVPIISAADYVLTKMKGDTLYVQFKDLTNLSFPFHHQITIQAMLIIPEDITLEVIGNSNELTLIPRHLASNWHIKKAYHVDVILEDNANLLIKAENVSELYGDGWHTNQQEDDINIMKLGAGDDLLSIQNTYMLSVAHP